MTLRPGVEMPNEYIGAACCECSGLVAFNASRRRWAPAKPVATQRCAATWCRLCGACFHRAGSFTYSQCPSYRPRGIAPVWRRRDARRSDFVRRLLVTLSSSFARPRPGSGLRDTHSWVSCWASSSSSALRRGVQPPRCSADLVGHGHRPRSFLAETLRHPRATFEGAYAARPHGPDR